jgi:hypothetical protein
MVGVREPRVSGTAFKPPWFEQPWFEQPRFEQPWFEQPWMSENVFERFIAGLSSEFFFTLILQCLQVEITARYTQTQF